MKRAFWFSLKVWLTGVLVGPVIAAFTISSPGSKEFVSVIALTALLGFFLTIPCWLILWFASYGISRVAKMSDITRKLILCLVGITLAIVTVYLAFNTEDKALSFILVSLSYCAPIVSGILLYRLGPKEELAEHVLSEIN